MLTARVVSAQSPVQIPDMVYYPGVNPGFTGATYGSRGAAGLRASLVGATGSFTTYFAGFDQYLTNLNAGLGFYLISDQAGGGAYSTTEIRGQYAYRLALSRDYVIQFGTGFGLGTRSLDVSGLTFEDQVDGSLRAVRPSGDPVAQGGSSVSYPLLDIGMMAYREDAWVGLSVAHVLSPNLNQGGSVEAENLPRRFSLQAGYRILLEDRVRDLGFDADNLTPTLSFDLQGPFQRLGIGAYGQYSGIYGGLYFYGAPWLQYDAGQAAVDAVAVQAGVYVLGGLLMYGYEQPLNSQSFSFGASHQVVVRYRLKNQRPRIIPQRAIQVPIPWTL